MLQVINVSEVKSDKNDRPFKVLKVQEDVFRTVKHPTLGVITVEGKPRVTAFTVSGQSYLDENPEYGYDAVEGSFIEGSVVTRQVNPYEIVNSKGETIEVNTMTRAILVNPEETVLFEREVKRVFGDQLVELTSEEAPVLTADA